MAVFNAIDFDDHERVVFCHDAKTNLKAIIAIHSTKLGPALGGCRMWNYESEEDAITDVLRLSRGMTYKAAMANLELGGGKSVIIGNSKKDKTPEMFVKFGEFIEKLGGDYITAEDVGTSVKDMGYIKQSTNHVVGIGEEQGGSGDPSPLTALGVFHSIRAAVEAKLGKTDLSGVHVAVQGLGNVGRNLCKLLKEAGADLTITDVDQERLSELSNVFSAKTVEPDKIYGVKADVFAPCALGAVVNSRTIEFFNFSIIAGAANNQLKRAEHGKMLFERGILYAPDYIVNAGGLINVYYETRDYSLEKVKNHIAKIHETLMEVFTMSEKLGISTSEAADTLARERIG